MSQGVFRPGADPSWGYYGAKIVADSVTAFTDHRITTFEVTMPKWLVAEFNTHSMVSRNSASSRAIPTETIIALTASNPVIPIDWRERVAGMEAGEPLPEELQDELTRTWLAARDKMIASVEDMNAIAARAGKKVDKQRVNRLLEPWMWTKIVATATEWENFFRLRNSPAAQPEFGYVAGLMEEAYLASKPVSVPVWGWHLPYVTQHEHKVFKEGVLVRFSAARCARVSYYRQGEVKSLEDEVKRAEDLAKQKHWSPLLHPARANGMPKFTANYYGWRPFRHFYGGESGSKRQGLRSDDPQLWSLLSV